MKRPFSSRFLGMAAGSPAAVRSVGFAIAIPMIWPPGIERSVNGALELPPLGGFSAFSI
jgi:hypothetical protein